MLLRRSIAISFLLSLLTLATPPATAAPAVPTLTLTEAERLALADDPAVQRLQSRAQAFAENAIADGQLADPKLKLGAANLPTDTFNRADTPMTQLQIGIRQAFPRGRSLSYRSRRTEAKGRAEQAMAEDKSLLVLREVRRNYLEAWYNHQAAHIIVSSRGLFKELVQVTEFQYSTGSQSQQDVASAQLELSLLEDRLTRTQEQEEIARAALSQWIGEAAAEDKLTPRIPELAALRDRKALTGTLGDHPLIRAEEARMEAADNGVQLALEQYKPGFAVDLTYGFRNGFDPDGSNRPDMFTGMVLIDIPLFTSKRQDKRLAASRLNYLAAGYARADRLRKMKRDLAADFSRWHKLDKRGRLYRKRLLREAKLNAQASLSAYQNGVTEFTTLIRARLRQLDTRLQALRIKVDRAKVQANILYLGGELKAASL
jgi:outer membrane protein TolC